MLNKTSIHLGLFLAVIVAGGMFPARGLDAYAAAPAPAVAQATATAATATAPDARAALKAANLAARREFVGKPMEISGKLLGGENFTTA